MQFRYEKKYALSNCTAEILRKRLAAVMNPDPHSNGIYLVNNLYLDDQYDSFYHERYQGKLIRDKIRVRFYNNNLSFIRLERKHKEGEFVSKDSIALTAAQYQALKEYNMDFINNESGTFWESLSVLHRMRRLKPAVEFSYLREAYVYEPGNVRITFDSRIGEDNITAGMLNDCTGVLEIKYCGFLPSVISCLLNGLSLTRKEMSKYCYMRERGTQPYVR